MHSVTQSKYKSSIRCVRNGHPKCGSLIISDHAHMKISSVTSKTPRYLTVVFCEAILFKKFMILIRTLLH